MSSKVHSSHYLYHQTGVACTLKFTGNHCGIRHIGTQTQDLCLCADIKLDPTLSTTTKQNLDQTKYESLFLKTEWTREDLYSGVPLNSEYCGGVKAMVKLLYTTCPVPNSIQKKLIDSWRA